MVVIALIIIFLLSYHDCSTSTSLFFSYPHHHHCRSYSPSHNHAIDLPLIKLKYFGWSFHHNDRSTLWKDLLLSSLQNHFRFSVSLSAIWMRIYIQHLENTDLDGSKQLNRGHVGTIPIIVLCSELWDVFTFKIIFCPSLIFSIKHYYNSILTHQGWIWLCLVWGPISLKV